MKKCIAPLFLFILIGVNAQTKLEKENEAIASSFVECWSADKYHDLPKLFADHCEYIEIPSGRTWNTPDAILGYAEATLSGIPDCHTKVVSLVANEKMATVEWIMEIEEGLITNNRDYWDVETFINAVSN